MTDLRIAFDGTAFTGDLVLGADGALALSEDLQSAVIVSLFSDGRAQAGDRLPDDAIAEATAADGRLRGWWGEAIAGRPRADGSADRFGSRLWLLQREKQTVETLRRAESYAAEALAWLVEDGIARAVRTRGAWISLGVLGLEIEIEQADASTRLDLRVRIA